MKCPICNSDSTTLLSSNLRENIEGEVLICKDCDHGFLHDKRTPKEIKEYYKPRKL